MTASWRHLTAIDSVTHLTFVWATCRTRRRGRTTIVIRRIGPPPPHPGGGRRRRLVRPVLDVAGPRQGPLRSAALRPVLRSGVSDEHQRLGRSARRLGLSRQEHRGQSGNWLPFNFPSGDAFNHPATPLILTARRRPLNESRRRVLGLCSTGPAGPWVHRCGCDTENNARRPGAAGSTRTNDGASKVGPLIRFRFFSLENEILMVRVIPSSPTRQPQLVN